MQMSVVEMRQAGVLNGQLPGFGNLGLRGLGFIGLGRESCPEGSRWDDSSQSCECYPGRVWMPDDSRCVSPQSPAYQQSLTIEEVEERGGGPETFAQQDIDPGVEAYLASQGVDVDCRIDPDWKDSPAGGTPSMLCSVDGGPHHHAAYAINLNPELALQAEAQHEAAQIISRATGTPPGAISSTGSGQALLQRTADALYRGEQVGEGDVSGAAMLHEMELQEQARQEQEASEGYSTDGQAIEDMYPGYGYGAGAGSGSASNGGDYYGTGAGQAGGAGNGLPDWVIPAAAIGAVFFLMQNGD